jgi:putative FmdB family regulatory protein
VPIYEYQCEVCHHTFEAIQKFSDEPIKTCMVCSGPVRRLLSPPALVFKGTGWYATDYASPERKKALQGEEKGSELSSDKGQAEGRKSQVEKETANE